MKLKFSLDILIFESSSALQVKATMGLSVIKSPRAFIQPQEKHLSYWIHFKVSVGDKKKIDFLIISLKPCLFNIPVVFILMAILFRLDYEEKQEFKWKISLLLWKGMIINNSHNSLHLKSLKKKKLKNHLHIYFSLSLQYFAVVAE